MFCKSCGTKIDDGAKFCPSCGTVLGENSNAKNQTLFIRANCSGTATKWFNFSLWWIGHIISFCATWLIFQFILNYRPFLYKYSIIRELASQGENADIGRGIFFWSFFILISPLVLFLLRSLLYIFKENSVSYNETEKRFYFNEHSHFRPSKNFIDIESITGVRYRYVHLGFFDKYCIENASDYKSGYYYAIAFSLNNDVENWDIWFRQKKEAEIYLAIVELALKSNNINIEISKNEELIEYIDYATEILENKEEVKKAKLEKANFAKKGLKVIFIIVCIILAFILALIIASIVNRS